VQGCKAGEGKLKVTFFNSNTLDLIEESVNGFINDPQIKVEDIQYQATTVRTDLATIHAYSVMVLYHDLEEAV
jgi:hypothetical protein